MLNALFWATIRRSFSAHGTAAGLPSDMSSVTEMILSAYTGWRWLQLGHDAIFVSGAAMESASAITFTRMPHLQRQDATISTINSLQCFRQADVGNCNAGAKSLSHYWTFKGRKAS